MNLQPSVTTSFNPLIPAAEPQYVPVGSVISELCPAVSDPVLCKLNGEWILRDDWSATLRPGDLLEWHVMPQGSGVRSVLQIAVMAAAFYFTAGAGAAMLGIQAGSMASFAVGLGINMFGNALISSVTPDQVAGGAGADVSPAYNANLSGNQSRIDSPIPVHYGYNKIWPDFAAQPYVTYDDQGDQFYHAVLVIGQGRYSIKRKLLDDTLLQNFQDVQADIRGPGDVLQYTSAAVTTATEVTGQDMLAGRYIGPYAACKPTFSVTDIGLDIVCPALGVAGNDGEMSEASISWKVQARRIDDFGLPAGVWVLVADETLKAASNSPVRKTYRYTLPVAGRWEVRLVRTSPEDDKASVYDNANWAGLRGYLNDAAPLCPTATHMEVRMRASEQLSGLSQRKIAVTAVRKLRTWSPAAGWSAEVETRSPAWALADKWSNTTYGDSLPDSRMDLATLYALAQVWDARQDRFDYSFDSGTDSDSADQLIARAGRARVYRRQGVRTIARDSAVKIPRRAFGVRNIGDGSWSISYPEMPTVERADGVRVEYFDYRVHDWRSIDCPLPGVATPTKWQSIRVPGVKGPKHAEREGRHMAAALLYRSGVAQWDTTGEGAVLGYFDPVRFAPPLIGWAASGDIVEWVQGTLTARLSEPVDVSGGNHSIVLVDHLGSAGDAIAVTQGADLHHVVLASAPNFMPSFENADRERTRWFIGTNVSLNKIVRVRSVQPAEKQFGKASRFTISGVIDDPRVHTADNALLPVGAEIQDPIDDGLTQVTSDPDGSAELLHLVSISSQSSRQFGTEGGQSLTAGIRTTGDGQLWLVRGIDAAVTATPVTGQWIAQAPATNAGVNFEILCEILPQQKNVYEYYGDGGVSTSVTYITPTLRADSAPTGVWIPASASLSWYADSGIELSAAADIRLSIRNAGETVVQGSAVMSLEATILADVGTGGGGDTDGTGDGVGDGGGTGGGDAAGDGSGSA
jgi:hypothetical protein